MKKITEDQAETLIKELPIWCLNQVGNAKAAIMESWKRKGLIKDYKGPLYIGVDPGNERFRKTQDD